MALSPALALTYWTPERRRACGIAIGGPGRDAARPSTQGQTRRLPGRVRRKMR
jgi:hypothetical protein